jgi:hypothetical protein
MIQEWVFCDGIDCDMAAPMLDFVPDTWITHMGKHFCNVACLQSFLVPA